MNTIAKIAMVARFAYGETTACPIDEQGKFKECPWGDCAIALFIQCLSKLRLVSINGATPLPLYGYPTGSEIEAWFTAVGLDMSEELAAEIFSENDNGQFDIAWVLLFCWANENLEKVVNLDDPEIIARIETAYSEIAGRSGGVVKHIPWRTTTANSEALAA